MKLISLNDSYTCNNALMQYYRYVCYFNSTDVGPSYLGIALRLPLRFIRLDYHEYFRSVLL